MHYLDFLKSDSTKDFVNKIDLIIKRQPDFQERLVQQIRLAVQGTEFSPTLEKLIKLFADINSNTRNAKSNKDLDKIGNMVAWLIQQLQLNLHALDNMNELKIINITDDDD